MVETRADLKFIHAVEAIYDAAPDPSRWPQALQAIADVFGDVGAILMWRRDDGSFGTIVSDTLIEAQKDYEQNGWSTNELRALRVAERGYFFSGGPFTDRHLCSDEEISTDPVYTQFCAHHGMGWFGAVAVSPDPHVGVGLSIQRNSRLKPPFSDSELHLVGRIGHHVEKSLRLSIRLLDAEMANVGLGEALARLGIGVFALDSLKRVVFANPAGERMLGDGLAIVNDRLLVGPSAERGSLGGAIEQMIRAAPEDIACEPKPILIRRQKSERPLAVYVLPVASSMNLAVQFLTHTRAIVLVIDPTANEPADPALVRDVLGLTLGEARVAALVGSGLPPREAAEKLGITEETARTALKRVFSKTGVSRQSELTALLTKLVLR
jgi:DNA-binding CsgD family transcriptional regulator/PAS domain-containing protein